jgi:hypothetical protein
VEMKPRHGLTDEPQLARSGASGSQKNPSLYPVCQCAVIEMPLAWKSGPDHEIAIVSTNRLRNDNRGIRQDAFDPP